MKFKNRVKQTWDQMFTEINKVDYFFFWVARILLLCAVVFARTPAYASLDSLNFLATFAISILRFFAGGKTFIGRIDFRIQHIINVFEVFGIFGGHLINMYQYVEHFDRHLHWLAGYLVVIAGYYLYKAFEMKNGKENYILNPQTAAMFSFGTSFFLIVAWEFSEFISDFFIGSNNQGYTFTPVYDEWWFKLFGKGAGAEGQFPLFDTMFDMLDAAVATIIATVILYLVLVRKNKKAAEKKQAVTAL